MGLLFLLVIPSFVLFGVDSYSRFEDKGAVVARVAATGLIKRLEPEASDGSERPVGILLADCDASLMERDGAFLLARHPVVASRAVVLPSGPPPGTPTPATPALAAASPPTWPPP